MEESLMLVQGKGDLVSVSRREIEKGTPVMSIMIGIVLSPFNP